MVGTNTAIGPGSDAAVVRVSPVDEGRADAPLKLLAMTTDGNGRLTYLHPFNGGALAVAEAARNCVVTGARPLALTNCLNFGAPEKPGAYFQMERAIDGMAEAARMLETPVISGNVSLYNESFGQGIYPTPVVGMVGLIEGRAPTPSAWRSAGDVVALLGAWSAAASDLGGSSYLATIHETVAGHPPMLDLDRERAVQALTLAGIERGLIRSAHDCSDGGLAVALAECAIWSGLGLRGGETALPGEAATDALAAIAALYGEAPSRIIVSVAAADYDALAALAGEHATPITRLGLVGGDRLTLGEALDVAIAEMRLAWRDGLRNALGASDAEQVAEQFAAD
jgi:phosphoribosylformylglycinamidine synthase